MEGGDYGIECGVHFEGRWFIGDGIEESDRCNGRKI
jgi:hypothetical protein